MDKPKLEITDWVYLSEIVSGASMDTYSDPAVVERAFTHWACRAIKKLTREIFKTGRRRALFQVNKQFNSITLEPDFTEALFIGYIDKLTGEKVASHRNTNLVNSQFLETIQDDVLCEARCTGCYSKSICNDLQTTETLRTINLGGTDYFETKTSTLNPDGTYAVLTETPFHDFITSNVLYKTKNEIITTLDLEPCGCVKATNDNAMKIKDCNYNCYCTYCSPLCSQQSRAGYQIFKETGTIKFDSNFRHDYAYLEWRGSVPKKNGQYVAPAVATETLIHLTKFLSIQNKKGVPLSERDWVFDQYRRERNNMEMVTGTMDFASIVYALDTTPKFTYHI